MPSWEAPLIAVFSMLILNGNLWTFANFLWINLPAVSHYITLDRQFFCFQALLRNDIIIPWTLFSSTDMIISSKVPQRLISYVNQLKTNPFWVLYSHANGAPWWDFFILCQNTTTIFALKKVTMYLVNSKWRRLKHIQNMSQFHTELTDLNCWHTEWFSCEFFQKIEWPCGFVWCWEHSRAYFREKFLRIFFSNLWKRFSWK